MHDHRDTISDDDGDGGGIASIGGGAAIASGGGVGALFVQPAATSGERSDSLLVPDASPTHAAPAPVGEEIGGTPLGANAGHGPAPV